jgi:hypothetical protein
MARLALGLLLRHVGLHDGHHGALLARLVVHHPESRRRERRRMRGYVKTRRARGEGRGQLRSPRLPLLGGQLEVNQLDPREASSLFLGGLFRMRGGSPSSARHCSHAVDLRLHEGIAYGHFIRVCTCVQALVLPAAFSSRLRSAWLSAAARAPSRKAGVIVCLMPLDLLITTNSETSWSDISRTCFVASAVFHQLDWSSPSSARDICEREKTRTYERRR